MRVIGIAGRAGSGKDTAAEYIRDWYEERNCVVHIVAFADPLKKMYSSFFEGDPNTEDRKVKDVDPVPRTGGKTMRYIMQALGTGFGRDLIHRMIWIWDLEYRIEQIEQNHEHSVDSQKPLVVIIKDVRFPDEVDMVHQYEGSYVIDLLRNEPEPLNLFQKILRRVLCKGPHISESAHYRKKLRSVGVCKDYVIHNNARVVDLYNNVRSILIGREKKHRVIDHTENQKEENMNQPTTPSVSITTGKLTVTDGSGNTLMTVGEDTTAPKGQAATFYGKGLLRGTEEQTDANKPVRSATCDTDIDSYDIMKKQVMLSEDTLATLMSRGFSLEHIQQAALGMLRFEQMCHILAVQAGWWTDLETGERCERNMGDLISLIHTEISEAYEAHRKNDKNDDHLTHRKGMDTELADAMIRISDACGALGMETVEAAFEKLAYNTKRVDHTLEHRRGADGKKS